MLQGEFVFEMKPVRLPVKTMSDEDRDRLIVAMRRAGKTFRQIKDEARCSDFTARKVVKRDAPELSERRKDAPRPDPRGLEQLLTLPPTDGEPLAKIGVHFFDIGYQQCRFIVAKDPDDKLARFCGEQTVGSCSWCAGHLAKVSVPSRFKAEAA